MLYPLSYGSRPPQPSETQPPPRATPPNPRSSPPKGKATDNPHRPTEGKVMSSDTVTRGRRPGTRALRPMVLLAALLAPAVLALGLLVAELTEFGVPPYLRAKPAEPPVFMAPTPLPRPLVPDRLYEGRVPARKPPSIPKAISRQSKRQHHHHKRRRRHEVRPPPP